MLQCTQPAGEIQAQKCEPSQNTDQQHASRESTYTTTSKPRATTAPDVQKRSTIAQGSTQCAHLPHGAQHNASFASATTLSPADSSRGLHDFIAEDATPERGGCGAESLEPGTRAWLACNDARSWPPLFVASAHAHADTAVKASGVEHGLTCQLIHSRFKPRFWSSARKRRTHVTVRQPIAEGCINADDQEETHSPENRSAPVSIDGSLEDRLEHMTAAREVPRQDLFRLGGPLGESQSDHGRDLPTQQQHGGGLSRLLQSAGDMASVLLPSGQEGEAEAPHWSNEPEAVVPFSAEAPSSALNHLAAAVGASATLPDAATGILQGFRRLQGEAGIVDQENMHGTHALSLC